jgi:hypothetical protein
MSRIESPKRSGVSAREPEKDGETGSAEANPWNLFSRH